MMGRTFATQAIYQSSFWAWFKCLTSCAPAPSFYYLHFFFLTTFYQSSPWACASSSWHRTSSVPCPHGTSGHACLLTLSPAVCWRARIVGGFGRWIGPTWDIFPTASSPLWTSPQPSQWRCQKLRAKLEHQEGSFSPSVWCPPDLTTDASPLQPLLPMSDVMV